MNTKPISERITPDPRTLPTPQPWFVAYGSVYAGDSNNPDNAKRILMADRNNPDTWPTERDANIALAAQAPTLLAQRDALLAACRRARNHLIMDIDRDGNGIHSTDSPDALLQVKQAIASVESEGGK